MVEAALIIAGLSLVAVFITLVIDVFLDWKWERDLRNEHKKWQGKR